MASFIYTNWKLNVGKKLENLSADALKVALFLAAYTPNQDTDTTFAGISANEVANGSGYTTGGVALASVAWAQDSANHRAKLTANNVSWTLTGVVNWRYAVLYDSTSGDLISLIDPGAAQAASSSININWDAVNGVLTLS